MGRREDRRIKKLKGEAVRSQNSSVDMSKLLTPFTMGDTRYIPVHVDAEKKPVGPLSSMPDLDDEPGGLTPEQFSKITHELSDKELNRIIYQNARMAVEDGVMPEWPEDDFGTVMWFTWNFITPEMRESFPSIAKEYLRHFRDEDCPVPEIFSDIPYPRKNEATWDDAYYFRVLLIMLYAARSGSAYSKNVLLSIYKVYHKQEYNKLKKLKTLTYLDILELHDEDCYRHGLSSGHTVDGKMSFREMQIEKRRHEPGWTNVFGNRIVDPVPWKKRGDAPNAEVLNKAVEEVAEMSDCPDEPPVQPVASRLIIMSELMGIEIDPTCNQQAVEMNQIEDSMGKISYLNSPEYRKIRDEIIERFKGSLMAQYPEISDPYEYQKNERYLGLQVAEQILCDVFRKYDTNVRLLYDSRRFVLPDLVADLTITLQLDFPEVQFAFDEVMVLSMVQYLAECLCEVLTARDNELEEVLRFRRRKETGEWEKEEKEDRGLAQKVLRSVESLRGREEGEEVSETVEEEPENLDEEALRAELARLREQLDEKSAALAESEQKVIRQRVLYEKEREKRQELEEKCDEREVEHAELLALREYVYGLRNAGNKEDIDLDEYSREKIIEKIKDRKVAVLGGQEKWVKRMKRFLPSWSFVSIDDGNRGSLTAIERANYVYMYTDAMKHSQYYRAMNIVRRDGKMLYYLGSGNVDECLKQFERNLCR